MKREIINTQIILDLFKGLKNISDSDERFMNPLSTFRNDILESISKDFPDIFLLRTELNKDEIFLNKFVFEGFHPIPDTSYFEVIISLRIGVDLGFQTRTLLKVKSEAFTIKQCLSNLKTEALSEAKRINTEFNKLFQSVKVGRG